MIANQETHNISPYMASYYIVVPKENMLYQINELVAFSWSANHICCQSETETYK